MKAMVVRMLRWLSLVSTAVTLSALTAHVVELPNKFTLEGPLWLAVQQNLYRGWGRFIGPFEVTAIVSTWVLLYFVRKKPVIFRLILTASFLLSAGLVVFFAFNAPVNAAFASWTAATLPPDWPNYRLRWEAGHAISFLLVLIAFILLLRALFREALASGQAGS